MECMYAPKNDYFDGEFQRLHNYTGNFIYKIYLTEKWNEWEKTIV